MSADETVGAPGHRGRGIGAGASGPGHRGRGIGAEVRGTAAALLCSLGRRTAALYELSGDGMSVLRQGLA